MLNKLLSIFPPLAIEQRIKIGHALGIHLSLQRFSQVNLKDMYEGHYVLVSNWMLMMTPLACVTS